jgi:hypothetical protein
MKRTLSWIAFAAGALFGVLALAELGALESHPGKNQWPTIATWIVSAAISLAGSWVAIYLRKLGGLILLVTSPLILLTLLTSYHTTSRLLSASILGLPLILGVFWWLTKRAGWPEPIGNSALLKHKVIASVLASVGVVLLSVLGSVAITMLSVPLTVNCGRKEPFASAQYEGQTVFVATLHNPGFADVTEHFWGLAENTKFVVIAGWGWGHNPISGNTYFVDGHRSSGLITRFLPIVEVSHCGRSNPLDRAKLDLRILRTGSSQKGVRIVGQVNGMHNTPRPDLRILVNGPVQKIETVTDKDGIFDLTDLEPGHYTVRVEPCEESKNPVYYRCSDSANNDLKVGDVWGTELRTD